MAKKCIVVNLATRTLLLKTLLKLAVTNTLGSCNFFLNISISIHCIHDNVQNSRPHPRSCVRSEHGEVRLSGEVPAPRFLYK